MRHSEPMIVQGIPYHQWGLTLSAPNYVKLALREMGTLLEPIEQVISSTEVKAIQTAELVTKYTGIPNSSSEAFVEVAMREVFVDAESFKTIRYQQFADPDFKHNHSETVNEAVARFSKGLEQVPENALIVSHGTMLTTYLNSIASRPLDELIESWNTIRYCAWAYIQDDKVQRFLS